MAEEKVIASLVGQLKFKADYRPLQNFEKRLDAVHEKMKQLSAFSEGGIKFKVGIDRKKFNADIKSIAATKFTLSDVNLDTSAALDKLQEKLDLKKLNIKNVTFRMSDIAGQKKLLRDMMESTTLEVGVLADTRPALDKLKTFKKNVESHFRIRISINETHWASQLLKAKQKMVERLEGTKVTTDLGFKFDKKQLLDEINSALRSLERKLELRVRVVEGGHAGGGSSGGMFGARHSMLAGGVAGAAAGKWGRGFIPGLGGAFAIKQMNDINQELVAQSLAMQAVMTEQGGPAAGTAEEQWFSGLADTLGLHKRQTMPAYTKMLASGLSAGMSVESTRNIFTGLSAYGQVMGVSQEQMAGALRAAEQMMAKGQIMSEELKGQMAERLPGVMSAMAEAAGFGTDDDAIAKLMKAMEGGKVKSKEVMEKFADILLSRTGGADPQGALAKAMQTTRAQQGRFLTQWDESIRKFAEAGFDKAIADKLAIMADGLKDNEGATKGLGEAFQILTKPFDAALLLLKDFGAALPGIASSLGMSTGKLISMGAIVATNLFPLGRLVTLISGAALAGQDFLRFLRGQDSEFGKWWNNISEEKRQALTGLINKIGELGGKFAGLATDVASGMGGVYEWFSGEPSVKLINGATSIAEAIGRVVDALRALKDFSFSEEMDSMFGGALNKSMQAADYAISAKRLGISGYSDSDLARAFDTTGMGGYTPEQEAAKSQFWSNMWTGVKDAGYAGIQGSVLDSKLRPELYPQGYQPATITIQNVEMNGVSSPEEFVNQINDVATKAAKGVLIGEVNKTIGVMAQQKR